MSTALRREKASRSLAPCAPSATRERVAQSSVRVARVVLVRCCVPPPPASSSASSSARAMEELIRRLSGEDEERFSPEASYVSAMPMSARFLRFLRGEGNPNNIAAGEEEPIELEQAPAPIVPMEQVEAFTPPPATPPPTPAAATAAATAAAAAPSPPPAAAAAAEGIAEATASVSEMIGELQIQ